MVDLPPAMEPTKYSSAHLNNLLQQILEIRGRVEHHKSGIEEQISSLESEIRNHLWVSKDFVDPASEGLTMRLVEAESLLDRLAKVEKSYKALPREDDDPGLVAYGNGDGASEKRA